MNGRLDEKIERVCQRVDSYVKKDASVKNEVKTKVYIEKIKGLINMIEDAKVSAKKVQRERRQIVEENDDPYNPYGNNFCYKDKLEQLDGDVLKLIEQLKSEDQEGYRNAYIINKIVDSMKDNNIEKEKNDKLANLSNKKTLWERIKRFFKLGIAKEN